MARERGADEHRPHGRGVRLDIVDSGGLGDSLRNAGNTSTGPTPKPWIGVRFVCAGAYVRVLRRPDADRYSVRCPRCGKELTVRVGPGGTSQRLFDAECGL